MKKIPLSKEAYQHLEVQAKIKGLTTDQLASEIVISKFTCHGCGLEWENCPRTHEPADPTKFPCVGCVRNPKRNTQLISKDFWDECWSLDENNLPFIER